MASLRDLKDRVDSALKDAGVDLSSQVWFTNDPIIVEKVLPRLDRSDEPKVTGVRKVLFPFGGGGRVIARNNIHLAARSTVRWHCHPDISVLHHVVSGHLIVERLRKMNGAPVVRPDGKFERDKRRLNPGDSWWSPPGEPYTYSTEDEAASTMYEHINDPFYPKVKACLDPSATAEPQEPLPPQKSKASKVQPKASSKRQVKARKAQSKSKKTKRK
jgi:hypothetical protein